jgi:rfaE bifunctional protein kinase chain/domain
MTEIGQHAKSSPGIGPKRLEALLNAFTGRKILVAGDLMLDEYVWGQASRISSEAPVLILDVQKTTHSLGGAANVARNVREMGAEATLVGVVGRDASADQLMASLESCGCSKSGIVAADDRPTTVKSRVVAQNQQIVRIDRETKKPVTGAVMDKLLSRIEEMLPAADAVILSDYAKGVLTDRLVRTVIKQAREYRVPVAANLKPPHVEAFRGATLLTLNLAEAERAWGRPIIGEAGLRRCGQELRKQLACKGLLITRGGDGVVLFASTGAPLFIPAQRVQVFDVTGAGDTVISAALLALSAGGTCAEAAAIGNMAGNIKVTKQGTAPVDRDEMRRFSRERCSEASSNEIKSDLGKRLRVAA